MLIKELSNLELIYSSRLLLEDTLSAVTSLFNWPSTFLSFFSSRDYFTADLTL